MSNESNGIGQPQTTWSLGSVAVLAIVCLVLGVSTGYVVRGSSAPTRPGETVAVANEPAPAAPAMPAPEQMKHMADKAAEPLLADLQKNPNDAATLAKVGKAYLYARQFDIAADYYERSVKIKADANVLTTLGGVYHFAGKNDKALEAWGRALKVDPNHADALVNIGLVKWRDQSDAKTAIALWKQMLRTHPNHPERARVEQMIATAQKHSTMPQMTGN